MRASVFMAGESFARLRRRIAEIEGRAPAASHLRSDSSLALREDTSMAPGACRAHPCPAPRRRHPALRPRRLSTACSPAASAATPCTRFAATRPAKPPPPPASPPPFSPASPRSTTGRCCGSWKPPPPREAGLPYGVGLDRLRARPARLIVVRVQEARPTPSGSSRKGSACRGLAAVLAEIRGNPAPARPHRQPAAGAPRPRRRRHGPAASPGRRGRARAPPTDPLAGRAAAGRRHRRLSPPASAVRPGG